jgi:hypothetical protein
MAGQHVSGECLSFLKRGPPRRSHPPSAGERSAKEADINIGHQEPLFSRQASRGSRFEVRYLK